MKNLFAFTTLAALLATIALPANAQNVGISGTVTNVQDESGVDVPAGILTLLVVDAGDDGFGFLTPGILQDDKFILGATDADLYLTQMSTTITFFGDSVAQFPNQTMALGTTNLLGDALTAGDNFYIVWFPDLPGGTTNLVAGDIFGYSRLSSWELPASGNIAGQAAFGGLANQVVIPEPSTYALIVMGLAIVGGLRFRRKQ